MAAISYDQALNLRAPKNRHHYGVVSEEIEGLIRVYADGRVERTPVVPDVPSFVPPELRVISKDAVIDKTTNLWARLYAPAGRPTAKFPLLVYFHGGGFSVGSAAWACYHDFLANLAATAGCVIASVNYHLAPESRLPAAYDDGVNAVEWVKQQASNGGSGEHRWWFEKCDLSRLFLAGDSAGANIAHHVASRVGSKYPNPMILKGTVLIQPFFGGEGRTESEKHSIQPPNSALSISSSDIYWRLALPVGATREHPWCNPLCTGAPKLGGIHLLSTLVCISGDDILRDRNMEFCAAMGDAGHRVQKMVYKGMGHAFQVLSNSASSLARKHEMMSHIKAFILQ